MNWIDVYPRDQHIGLIKQVSEFYSQTTASDEVLALNKLVQSEDFRSVVDFPVDYSKAKLTSEVIALRQIKALVEKQDFLDLGYNPLKVAERKFVECERVCRETNDRLSSCKSVQSDVACVLHIATRKIARILGPVPSLSELSFSFGPGANTNVKMAEACYRAKLSAELVCSDDMLPVVGDFLAEFPLWVAHHSGVSSLEGTNTVNVTISSGKLVFVPKSSKTLRPIVVEPLLNSIMQKGIGGYMKKCLKRVGVDLTDQTRNQELARLGSLTGSLATVDLASASDTVSIAIVLDLLPFPWFELLSSCRTGSVEYDGCTIQLEKFSSMGNGYTFELESLLFYGLAFGVCSHLGIPTDQLGVYGDDIIIPTGAFELLVKVLEHCGFAINRDKTFSEGPFRESCGADWFFGLDVRPFYLRHKISGRVLFLFHNWAVRNCEPDLAKEILKWIPDHLRLFGPNGFGDGHLIGDYSLRLNRSQRRNGWGGGFFDTYTLGKRLFNKLLPGDWLVPCYSIYTRNNERDPLEDISMSDPNVVRGSRGYAKTSIYTLKSNVY